MIIQTQPSFPGAVGSQKYPTTEKGSNAVPTRFIRRFLYAWIRIGVLLITLTLLERALAGDLTLQISPGGGDCTITFGPVQANHVYNFYGTTNLSNPQWELLPNGTFYGNNLIPSGWDHYFFVDSLPSTGQKFYRVQDRAYLMEPDTRVVPSDMGCNAGQPFGLQILLTNLCVNGECEASVWHTNNDNSCIPSQQSGLNARLDGAFNPAIYFPTGTVSVRLASRGTTMFNCSLAWYNANGSKPGFADLHEMLNCSQSVGAVVSQNIAADPNYLGGPIGFALITPDSPSARGSCASGNCCASVSRFAAGQGTAYYTQADYNPDAYNGTPYQHCIAYKSRLLPNRYYLAWEDSYGVVNNDFMDMVIVLDGCISGE